MSDRFSVPAVEWQAERAVPAGHEQLDIPDLKNSLRSLMGRSVGIVRNEQEFVGGLQAAGLLDRIRLSMGLE
jgi:hypothetical protein